MLYHTMSRDPTPEHRSSGALRALGALGLVGVLVSVFLISAGAASGPSEYVPGRSGGWPDWMAGPLRGLGIGITSGSFQALMLIMCASYLAVLAASRALSLRVLAGAIVAANLILLLGPPLISQDVFGYEAFARMGVLHGLDPYTHVAFEAPTDPIYPYIGWPFQHSPYGPLFTLASYAAAPLGLAGGLWALKATAVMGSLAAVALTARAAGALGRSRRFAAAFLGLNPVMLVLAVGGAHNDTLVLAFLAGALLLTAGTAMTAGANDASSGTQPRAASTPRMRAGALTLAAGVGIKVTAGVALPFLLLARTAASPATTSRAPSAAPAAFEWRERARVASGAVAGLALVAAVGLIGFGSHAFGFLDAVGEQQQLIAVHSIPAETARLFDLHGTPRLVAALLCGGVPDCSCICAVAHGGTAPEGRGRCGLARGGWLEHAGAAVVYSMAAAVVCGLAAAASCGLRRSALAGCHAARLCLRHLDPPAAC